MANVRLENFTLKSTLDPSDIVYCGDSANTFNEVQTTVAGLIGAYANLLLSANGGAITQSSITFTSTSGVIGTKTNDSAAAGSVGELDSVIVLVGAAVSLTSTVEATIANIVLQPGDYDVWGEFWSAPAGGTTTSLISAGLNISAALPTVPAVGTALSTFNTSVAAGIAMVVPINACRISVATATTATVYLRANLTFAASTMGGYGKIMARRRR